MKPAQIIVEIANAGACLWAEGDHLKFRGIPSRLIPHIREHKTELLALIASTTEDDCYEAKERIRAQRGFRSRPPESAPALRGTTDDTPAPDDYDRLEREAIQWESDLPPFDDPDGTAGIAGFEGLRDLTPAQHGVILRRCGTTTHSASVRHSEDMPPQRVHCGDCGEFEPGTTHYAGGIGKCSRTATGLPPIASKGYGACFPMAPRTCPDFQPLEINQ